MLAQFNMESELLFPLLLNLKYDLFLSYINELQYAVEKLDIA